MTDRKLQIKYKLVADLIPYSRNARLHSEEQVNMIVKSIEENGFTNPILIDGENGIIAGHGRLKAVQKLGMEKVPTIDLSHLSDEQKRKYIIADNQISDKSTWDWEILAVEMGELKAADIEITDLGFNKVEIKDIFGSIKPELQADPDDCPEPPENPVSKAGDLWILGNHKLYCGDATLQGSYEALMGSERADLVFTDPPYGVNFERGKFVGREKQAKGKVHKPIANDELKGDDLTGFLTQTFLLAHHYSKDDVASIYSWAPSLIEGLAILQSCINAGWKINSQIIWNKSPFVIGRNDYHWKHEVCWYGHKEGQKHAWYGGRDKATVWDVPKAQKMDLHPTMKPVRLPEIALENNTKPEDIVLDIFAGSGSTLIAAEKLNRRAFVMELEPIYSDVICERYIKLTGKTAILAATGQTFEEVRLERLGLSG